MGVGVAPPQAHLSPVHVLRLARPLAHCNNNKQAAPTSHCTGTADVKLIMADCGRQGGKEARSGHRSHSAAGRTAGQQGHLTWANDDAGLWNVEDDGRMCNIKLAWCVRFGNNQSLTVWKSDISSSAATYNLKCTLCVVRI